LLFVAGAAVSRGFAYLLLPAMREDLGWSYALAGGMNTANALGYFLGALVTPYLMKRIGASGVLWLGAVFCSLFMGFSGFFVGTEPLLLQRLLAGVASALVFISGVLLAARLQDPPEAASCWVFTMAAPGWASPVPFGASGVGVVRRHAHNWQWAGGHWRLPCGGHGFDDLPARDGPLAAAAAAAGVSPCFVGGLWLWFGRIHHVWCWLHRLHDLVVALLRTQGRSGDEITVFNGLRPAVMASSRIWAKLRTATVMAAHWLC
jgi:MFS family permease